MNAEDTIRRYLQTHGEATRPQLAAAAGVSTVRAGQMVARLCRTGELEEAGLQASGGGRPVMRYRYRAAHGERLLLHVARSGRAWAVRAELRDLCGGLLHAESRLYAALCESSLDAWLDTLLPRSRRLQGICLLPPAGDSAPALLRHLAARYSCPVRELSPAEALAEHTEGTLTLCLARAQHPSAAFFCGGSLRPCGPLWLLPMPADWTQLDYADHTLTEEMTSRLLAILCCTLSPRRMVLHADFLSPKLIARIRFNTSAKLRPLPPPELLFAELPNPPGNDTKPEPRR